MPVSHPLGANWGLGRIVSLKEGEPTVSLQWAKTFLIGNIVMNLL